MTDEVPFRPVHWIQARLAWQDNETWESATVVGVDPPVVIVEDADGGRRSYRSGEAGFISHIANQGTTAVWITERWGVLALEAEQGQVMRNPSAKPKEPGSIFVLSGAHRLRFVNIRAVDDE